VTGAAQRHLEERADALLVFRQQDCGRLHARRREVGRTLPIGGRRGAQREIRAERGPFVDRGVDLDHASALAHDPEHGRQAEARALARRFSGEKWLEDVLEGLGINALAVVGHRKHHERARRHGEVRGTRRLDAFAGDRDA
jgi:hypothetical protein